MKRQMPENVRYCILLKDILGMCGWITEVSINKYETKSDTIRMIQFINTKLLTILLKSYYLQVRSVIHSVMS